MLRKIIFSLVFTLLVSISWSQSELLTFLNSISGAQITRLDSSVFSECYIVMLPQKVDHSKSGDQVFMQRIIVGHRNYESPVVMVTEGYGAEGVNGFSVTEPADILAANQIYVEHRYFGASVPDPVDWQYLNAQQDAGDYHYIRKLFSGIYKGKWIATGVSKGGQTTLEYAVFYPGDVDVYIPYVAPVNYKRIDPRIEKHFRKTGTAVCRKNLRDIQYYYLQNKQRLLPLYEDMCRKQRFNFDLMEAEKAFDYSVLEFPFSFWQYFADCGKLVTGEGQSDEKMVIQLLRIVSPYWYTNAVNNIRPAFYQFYTQLGYYEYNEKPFRKYLKYSDYPNSDFVPAGIAVQWDPSYQKMLKAFIKSNPDRFVFIYGAVDPWGATGARIKPTGKSLKLVQEGGTHTAQLSTMNTYQKAKVAAALSRWLEQPVALP